MLMIKITFLHDSVSACVLGLNIMVNKISQNHRGIVLVRVLSYCVLMMQEWVIANVPDDGVFSCCPVLQWDCEEVCLK